MSKTKFQIGDIVSLKTNHLQTPEDYKNIWLSGDPNFATPLMVVKEISINTSQLINEENGKEKKDKRKIRYLCIHFSNKHLKFEENWFYQEELLVSKFKLPKKKKSSIKRNSRVVFKTNSLEVGKSKTFTELSNKRKTRKSSSLLTFSSPVFIVSGFPTVQKKIPEIDPVSGMVKHVYPKKLVKLKFFNSLQDKFSEFVVPKRAILNAEIPNAEFLKIIMDAKANDNPTVVSTLDDNGIYSLGTIDSILFVSDDYLINTTDLFKNEEVSIKFSEISEEPKSSSLKQILGTADSYPQIVASDNGSMNFSVYSISDKINKLWKDSKKTNRSEEPMGDYLFKISYTNRSNKQSERYILPFYIAKVSTIEQGENGEDKEIIKQYLYGYCLLKEEKRHFLVDRIRSLIVVKEKNVLKIAEGRRLNDGHNVQNGSKSEEGNTQKDSDG